MNKKQTVTFEIKADGSGDIKVTTEGFNGKGCDVINQVEKHLGKIKKTKKTSEAFLHDLPDPVFNNL